MYNFRFYGYSGIRAFKTVILLLDKKEYKDEKTLICVHFGRAVLQDIKTLQNLKKIQKSASKCQMLVLAIVKVAVLLMVDGHCHSPGLVNVIPDGAVISMKAWKATGHVSDKRRT